MRPGERACEQVNLIRFVADFELESGRENEMMMIEIERGPVWMPGSFTASGCLAE